MADVTRCAHCGARIFALQLSNGTKIELNATPNPFGCWALVKGEPRVAVKFAAGKIVGRLPGFENAELLNGHYGNECASTAALKAQGIGKKTGS